MVEVDHLGENMSSFKSSNPLRDTLVEMGIKVRPGRFRSTARNEAWKSKVDGNTYWRHGGKYYTRGTDGVKREVSQAEYEKAKMSGPMTAHSDVARKNKSLSVDGGNGGSSTSKKADTTQTTEQKINELYKKHTVLEDEIDRLNMRIASLSKKQNDTPYSESTHALHYKLQESVRDAEEKRERAEASKHALEIRIDWLRRKMR